MLKKAAQRANVILRHLGDVARYGMQPSRPLAGQRRIEIAAIASNEGPYIAEWIHHHLAFGADAIYIAVNRSTDHTTEIVAKIAASDHRVVLIDGDAFDVAGPGTARMQDVAYQSMRAQRRLEGGAQDHLLFMDVDEFWLPRDLTQSMPDWFAAQGWPRIASFNWMQVTSDTTPFVRMITPDLRGRFDPQLKTAARNDLPAFRIDPHTLRSLMPVARHVASGLGLMRGNPGRTRETPEAMPEVCIAHRMFRSPVEYLAILGRMRPHETDAPFKTNRFGYQVASSAGAERGIDVNLERCRMLAQDYDQFLRRHRISELIETDRQALRDRARVVLQRYLALSDAEREVWIHGFLGLDIAGLERELRD